MSRSKLVLIIDDDERHLLTARAVIESMGYRVEIHNSPFRSTEKVYHLKPDLVLLDVNMPALPGDRLCKLLRNDPALTDLPIFLYSSNDEDILRRSVRTYQASGYVCKGNIGNLQKKVRQVLDPEISSLLTES